MALRLASNLIVRSSSSSSSSASRILRSGSGNGNKTTALLRVTGAGKSSSNRLAIQQRSPSTFRTMAVSTSTEKATAAAKEEAGPRWDLELHFGYVLFSPPPASNMTR